MKNIILPDHAYELKPEDTLQAGDIIMSPVAGEEDQVSLIVKQDLIGKPVSTLSYSPAIKAVAIRVP